MAGKIERKENAWVKFLRAVIYALSISGAVIGASLIKTGNLSSAYADGTHVVKIQNGEIIFFVSLVILSANIVWGIARWFLHGYHEQWRPWRIVGKLVGGGIWRVAVIAPLVLLSALFIAPQTSKIISSNVTEKETPLMALSQSYDDLRYVNDNIDRLSFDEIEKKLAPLMFNNIDFDTNANGNISHNSSFLFVNNASAYSSTVTILNKAKLSSGGHFVVFYTDTGDDRISDDAANKLTVMLEEIISGYNDKLELAYEYEKLPNNNGKLGKMKKVLRSSGIDEDILDSAMPIYVVDPYKDGSSTLASYAGRRFKDLGASILVKLGSLFGEETAQLYNSTPSYPFINIRPQNAESESLAIVTAHELGHHYVSTYSYDTYGKTGSDDNFLDETTPNWMAINVLRNQPAGSLVDKHYNIGYLGEKRGSIQKIDEAIPKLLGYPAVAFLENYYEIVPNAKTIILDATYHGDALNYLYDKAGPDNYRKVMVSLAEKNLTGDYDGRLINSTTPMGELIDCVDVCEQKYWIQPSSTRYLYFATDEYKNTHIGFAGDKDVYGSLLGLKYDGKYEIINSGDDKIDFLISDDTVKEYEVVVFAVANASITDMMSSYKISIITEEIEELITTTGQFDFGDWFPGFGAGCHEVDVNRIFDNLIKMIDVGSSILSMFADFDQSSYSDLQTEYDEGGAEAKEHIINAKNELSPYRVTVCTNYIKPGEDFNVVKRQLQLATGSGFSLFDQTNDLDRTSIFLGFDLLQRKGNVYVLGQHATEMGLLVVSISER